MVHHVDHVPWHNEVTILIATCDPCHMVHHNSKDTLFPWLDRLAVTRSMKMPDG